MEILISDEKREKKWNKERKKDRKKEKRGREMGFMTVSDVMTNAENAFNNPSTCD